MVFCMYNTFDVETQKREIPLFVDWFLYDISIEVKIGKIRSLLFQINSVIIKKIMLKIL